MVHGNWLAKWSLIVGGKPALIDLPSGRAFTYAELDRRADRAARVLADQFQVGPGDRVGVLGSNRVEQVELFFAVAKLGAVLVPVNWRLAPEEVAYILDDSTPQVLLYGADVAATARALSQGLWTGPLVPFDRSTSPLPPGEGQGEGPSYASLVSAAPDGPVETEGITDETPLMLLYTSGTTGRPKGAILTHGTITWNAVNTATSWDLHHDDITLTHTPFFHTGGWNVLTLPLLHRGATVVLAPGFDAAETVRALERYRITILFAVPTMFQMMLDCGALDGADLSSVRFFISGGAACPIPLIEAYQKRSVVFKQGYGLTEVGPNCFVLHERDAIRKAGSVGFPVLHLDTRIADRSGNPVERGQVGELLLAGPTVCAGYWNNPEATRQALSADGWFSTGDLFRQDEQGYHYVVGRLKEMYISGGENIYPAEIERVLHQIPGVIEAAVVGVPDPRWGEVGHAFVAFERGPEAAPSGTRIIDLARQQLARYKVPKYLTVLDQLPKGPSGKILKSELVALAAQMRSL